MLAFGLRGNGGTYLRFVERIAVYHHYLNAVGIDDEGDTAVRRYESIHGRVYRPSVRHGGLHILYIDGVCRPACFRELIVVERSVGRSAAVHCRTVVSKRHFAHFRTDAALRFLVQSAGKHGVLIDVGSCGSVGRYLIAVAGEHTVIVVYEIDKVGERFVYRILRKSALVRGVIVAHQALRGGKEVRLVFGDVFHHCRKHVRIADVPGGVCVGQLIRGFVVFGVGYVYSQSRAAPARHYLRNRGIVGIYDVRTGEGVGAQRYHGAEIVHVILAQPVGEIGEEGLLFFGKTEQYGAHAEIALVVMSDNSRAAFQSGSVCVRVDESFAVIAYDGGDVLLYFRVGHGKRLAQQFFILCSHPAFVLVVEVILVVGVGIRQSVPEIGIRRTHIAAAGARFFQLGLEFFPLRVIRCGGKLFVEVVYLVLDGAKLFIIPVLEERGQFAAVFFRERFVGNVFGGRSLFLADGTRFEILLIAAVVGSVAFIG